MDNHWWGMVAINPWKNIVQSLYHEEDFDGRSTEWDFLQDSINGVILADGRPQGATKKYLEAQPLLWFLNFASAYRDMRIAGKLDKMPIESFGPLSYLLYGLRGPFGTMVPGCCKIDADISECLFLAAA